MIRYPNKKTLLRPSDELLRNPHKGFTTFQRFRGDALNEEMMGEPYSVDNAWRMEKLEDNEGMFRKIGIEGYPDTSLAYFRIPWRKLEPEQGKYDFSLIDKILKRAEERGQKVLFRFPPHSQRPDDDLELPEWVIKALNLPKREVGDKSSPLCPLYFESYSALIRKIGEHIDGDERVSLVDISLVSAWGEGAQADMLEEKDWKMLADAYIEGFKNTHLVAQFNHAPSIKYILKKRPIGIRADCLGDMRWRHMTYLYPRAFAEFGELWKRAPIAFESCWVMKHWYEMGWDIDYIIEESLGWHISSFNEKSVFIPEQYTKKVEEWIKRMGYRFAIRISEYPDKCLPGDTLSLSLCIQNLGVAPIYYSYPVIVRLKGVVSYDTVIKADIRDWLPGNHLIAATLELPCDLPRGEYALELGITDGVTDVLFANNTARDGAFSEIGRITVG